MTRDGRSGYLVCLFFLAIEGSISITKCFTKGKKLYQFSPVVGESIAQESMYFCSVLHKRLITDPLLQPHLFIPRLQSCFQSELSFLPPSSHKILRTGSPCRLHFVLDLWSSLPFSVLRLPTIWERDLVFLNIDYYTGHLLQYHSWKPGYARNQTVNTLTCTWCKAIRFCIVWIKLKAAAEKQHQQTNKKLARIVILSGKYIVPWKHFSPQNSITENFSEKIFWKQ